MDYFNSVITTFLGLQQVSCIAFYGGSDSFIKYILICLLKMNEGLTGLEQREGE